ncbi:gamma-tubulin complex component 5 [Leptinotarsa decemlineata]|uniref:gamma-tubulin complex component 5 n=1 Tax=Leptinotarsa decemlineata TaxID=7539 RepID=UPI003D3086C8
MARPISADIGEGVKELIKQISGFEEGSEPFIHVQKYFLTKLKNSDTMYFLNKRDVDRIMSGMAEKFNFHGFFNQAKALQDAYDNYIPPDLPKDFLSNRLNIVKFLLCMSEKPTSKFLEKPEEYEMKPEEEEEEVNWAEYLKEGIENWAPDFDESSEYSEDSSVGDIFNELGDECSSSTHTPQVITSNEKDVIVNLRANREELLNTIQHSWYNQDHFYEAPFSELKEANVGINWENFLEKQVMGLIVMPKVSVISEYKVIREVLWQLWTPHTSAVFEFEGNTLKPRENVTISSTRSMTLESFLQNQFIPFIELTEFFRDFSKSLDVKSDDYIMSVPQTFRSYNNSLQNIIRPIYVELSNLEDRIREQESTYTLLNLARDLEEILEPMFLLKKIHNHIVIDFKRNSHLTCASTLLARLHDSIEHSESKLDQDLRLALYLGSLYHYFSLIDSWLMKNDLTDYSCEFLINNKNKSMSFISCENDPDESVSDSDICKLNFDLYEELDKTSKENGVMKIIRDMVLQIGRNLHLLRLLGKFSFINESKETIHEEFVRKTLEGLCKFFDVDTKPFITIQTAGDSLSDDDDNEMKYKYPVVCTEDCKKPTEMDKLENLVDTTDGFLMYAFEDYFIEQPKKIQPLQLTLYEKISRITTTFFPISNFFENILSGILKERFTVSGLMVKNMLIEQYFLEKQFQFLRHMFLFFDNMIFPFYMRLFKKTNSCSKNWGNDIWLTSHLQDIIMDAYPEFYDKCAVQVGKNWRVCSDSSEACDMTSLVYEIQWPLNIIISPIHMALYKELFHFILKIKWGLYTLNHLVFTDLEPRKKTCQKDKPKSHKSTIMKLKFLKFGLTNLLTSIQHYIFSFIFSKCLQKFELDFEKANDLSSVMASHSEFINAVHSMTMDIKNCGKEADAFENVTSCVRVLKTMWNNVESATPDRLQEYCKIYEKSFNIINPLICPEYLFDY